MRLESALSEYEKTVTAWLDQAKRQVSAVQRLQKMVADGNLRDLERARQAARNAATVALERAEACEPLAFDAAAYLSEDDGFLKELAEAADKASVRLFERDGVVFCYPVLVRPEPALSAVRIDKRLEPALRPSVLAALLKRAQSREPKFRPEAFIEVLLQAYLLVRAKRGTDSWLDVPLTQVYEVLTLLPGSDREYTLLDFTRDIYLLDSSGTDRTKKGFVLSLPASTVSRERSARILRFVTRDGYEKDYAAIKFAPDTEES